MQAKPSSDTKICSRCIMDTTVPEIRFDENGVCQYCHMHDEMEKLYPLSEAGQKKLAGIVKKIKRAGKNKPYDCVCGVSGGRDSIWTLYTAVKLGLRPLAVHFDNGWNTAIAVKNIQKATNALNIDLETVVADWDEFKDLQRSFLKASVPDVEVPTDIAIHTVLHKIAAQEGIRYILNGHSFRTEGIMPKCWSYMDGRYIRGIQKQFGSEQLEDYHNFGIKELIYYSFIKRISVVPILNFAPYDHDEIGKILEEKLGWQYYGGHHHESTYTAFIQSYLLTQKFNIDKRKAESSALIRSGQASRQETLKHLSETPYEYDETLIDYILAKLNITHAEWDTLFNKAVKSFNDYPTYMPMIKTLSWPIKIATKLNLLPKLLYLKFLG